MKRHPMVWTYTLAMAAGKDAANRQMRKAQAAEWPNGRTTWNEDDWNLMVATVDRLHPERIPQHEKVSA